MKYAKVLSSLCGGLSVLAFAPWYQMWAAFVSFSVLIWLLLNAKTAKESFVKGYCFGFFHFALGLSWVGNALLIDAETFGWLYPVTLGGAGLFFGLFFAIPAWVAFYAKQNWQKWGAFCSCVVIGEWLRCFIFTGFPWNLIGYNLAFSTELIQFAAVGGTLLLSLVSLLCYSVFGLVLFQKDKISWVWGLLFCVAVFGGLYGFGRYRLAHQENLETDKVVKIVQPSIPQTLKWDRVSAEDNFKEYIDLTEQAEIKVPDLIIWGETASPFILDKDDFHRNMVNDVLPEKSYLVTGMIHYTLEDEEYIPHYSLAVFDKAGDLVDYYYKSHLVPFGEYIPLRNLLPSFLRPIANQIGTFGRGDGPKVIALDGLPTFGGVICYEIIFPHEIVKQNQRPEFLINLSNDGWYGDSAGPYQHWEAAKLRAVEDGMTVVRAANNGISGMISAYGE
ncbi:MAG: apolipoprotein N-acyltransferase, partial [Alphaproteobacteria bacterium]|nr:apolipoprotein N-acyltransferase [Alphaproteobacteria bacterium]